jgi:hypothetical protein
MNFSIIKEVEQRVCVSINSSFLNDAFDRVGDSVNGVRNFSFLLGSIYDNVGSCIRRSVKEPINNKLGEYEF